MFPSSKRYKDLPDTMFDPFAYDKLARKMIKKMVDKSVWEAQNKIEAGKYFTREELQDDQELVNTWNDYRVETKDNVNSPAHYNLNEHGIECIQAIEASMSKEEFQGYVKGNCVKYIWRYKNKGKAKEDLQKAQWYLNKLIETVK